MSRPWEDTQRELDRWAGQGLKATFWIRDDDAIETSDRLTRLHDLAERHDVTIGLAAIPAKLHPNLPQYIRKDGYRFHPMCHGWRHVNHARAGSRPSEFGRERPISALIRDARLAHRAFSNHFGDVGAVFVPPFGRISRALVSVLPEIGFSGISGAAGWLERKLSHFSDWHVRIPATASFSRSDMPKLDVQIDPIDWRDRTAHEPLVISQALVRCLRARRFGLLASTLPIGLVTHHLDHDERVWQICDNILGLLRRHEAIRFLHVGQFFQTVREGHMGDPAGERYGAKDAVH
jgi:hypothetical protein